MNSKNTKIQFCEDDLLPVSALADIVYCERRAALHHLEQIWQDNVFTIEGTHLHEKVDAEEPTETKGEVRISRGMMFRSFRLGLVGKADVVEFRQIPPHPDPLPQGERGYLEGIVLEGLEGLWTPYPIEYKRGKLRHEEGFELQVCAQALCLEEMLNCPIPKGAMFYGKTKRRLEVEFTETLRDATEDAAKRLHRMFRERITPKAVREPKCDKCSLFETCMPEVTDGNKSVKKYLEKFIGTME